MQISREFESRQSSSKQDDSELTLSYKIETTVKLDSDERLFEIDTREYGGSSGTPEVSYGVKAILSDWSKIEDVAEMLRHHSDRQDDRTRTLSLPIDSGTAYNRRIGREERNIDVLKFSATDSDLEILTPTQRGRLPFYNQMIDHEIRDRRNVVIFLDMINELFNWRSDQSLLDLQHPVLRTDAVPEYVDGHYQSSVRTAYRVLEEEIRGLGDFAQDETGMSLAREAFKPQHGPLAFAEAGAEREGWMFLYSGGFGALRNPPSHRDEESIDQQRAKQILHFVDLLLDVLDREVGAEENH